MSNLMAMSYKTFFFRDNPVSLSVEEEKNVKEILLPFCEAGAEELGSKKRRVRGEGYLTGTDCWQQWNALQEVYREAGPGSLRLPGQLPFLAVMEKLQLIGAAGENLLKYAFSFVEWESGKAYSGRGIHRAEEGESLWDYAYRFGRTVEELVEANPQIRDIACLACGEKVVVP